MSQVLQAKPVNKWYRGSHTVISVHCGEWDQFCFLLSMCSLYIFLKMLSSWRYWWLLRWRRSRLERGSSSTMKILIKLTSEICRPVNNFASTWNVVSAPTMSTSWESTLRRSTTWRKRSKGVATSSDRSTSSSTTPESMARSIGRLKCRSTCSWVTSSHQLTSLMFNVWHNWPVLCSIESSWQLYSTTETLMGT